nr:MAG TPA: hypothetical protein [Caudoviricetes sp.]
MIDCKNLLCGNRVNNTSNIYTCLKYECLNRNEDAVQFFEQQRIDEIIQEREKDEDYGRGIYC